MSLEQHANYSWAISAPSPCSTSTEKASESHFSSLPNSRAECGKLLQKAPLRKRQQEAKPLTDPTCSHRSSKPPGATAEESRAPSSSSLGEDFTDLQLHHSKPSPGFAPGLTAQRHVSSSCSTPRFTHRRQGRTSQQLLQDPTSTNQSLLQALCWALPLWCFPNPSFWVYPLSYY